GIDRGQWYDVSGESGYIQARPDNPDITYGGDNSTFLARLDHKTGFWRMISPWPDSPDGHAAGEGKYRFQWTAPLLISPHDPNVLYIGGNRLFKTVNEGQSWSIISPDLTRHDPKTLGPSGGPITLDQTTAEYYATIFALAESPLVKGLIWAGSDDGLIHLTRDGGTTWTDVTPKALGAFTRVSIIEPSHYAPGTAYVAANRYQLEDLAPYIWKTTDYGRSWVKLVTGLPATEFVRVVREDPVRRGLLFAGTERGVWVSFDDGAHWQTLRRNLPFVPVHDLAIKEGDLVAATHGRSFWILDDVSPLRQLARTTPSEPAHLFKPRDAYRVDWGGGAPAGTDAHPVGKNPPSGPMIYYWLKDKQAEVTLDILDPRGRVIRSFSSKQDSIAAADSLKVDAVKRTRTDSLKKAGITDSTKIDSILGTLFADTLKDEDKPWPRRPPAEPRVPAKVGLNMFAWNLRYPPARPFWGMNGVTTDGPVALPGSYQVRLTVGGKAHTEGFTLKPDPRSKAAPADLAAQFAFLQRVRDTVNAATTALITIRNVRAQLEDAAKRAPATAAAARPLLERLTATEDGLYQVRSQADEDGLVYPPGPLERLSGLIWVAGASDARPPAQVEEVFRLFAPQIERQLVALRQALERDLLAVNQALRSTGAAPVVPRPAELRPPSPVTGR
ncbi:MAG TPA: glycosyl hydrolase, partial [Gemmatimonadales bacterium]|nr:glycosyl hydrolase [Gemmatimonadales bacterium]